MQARAWVPFYKAINFFPNSTESRVFVLNKFNDRPFQAQVTHRFFILIFFLVLAPFFFTSPRNKSCLAFIVCNGFLLPFPASSSSSPGGSQNTVALLTVSYNCVWSNCGSVFCRVSQLISDCIALRRLKDRPTVTRSFSKLQNLPCRG